MAKTFCLVFGFVLACALTKTLAADSCAQNPAHYLTGIIPQSGASSHTEWARCNYSTGTASCCNAETQAELDRYMADLEEVAGWLHSAIAGINNLNLGLINNIGFVDSILGLVSPLFPTFFGTPCAMSMPPGACGSSVLAGLVDSTTYPNCQKHLIPALAVNLVTNHLPDVRNVLRHLHSNWPLYENIVTNATEAIETYAEGVVCSACDPNFRARRAMPLLGMNLWYFEGTPAASEPFVDVIRQLHDPLLEAVFKFLDMAIRALDSTAAQCRLQVETSVGYDINAFLATFAIPTKQIWDILAYELGVAEPSVMEFLGTMTKPVLGEYDVTTEVIEDFVTWTSTCSDGILWLAVDAIGKIPPEAMPDGFPDLSILGSLSGLIYDIAGNNVDKDFCALGVGDDLAENASPFGKWLGDLVVKLLSGQLENSRTIPWAQADAEAFAASQRTAALATATGDHVSPWGLHMPVPEPEAGAPDGWIPSIVLGHRRSSSAPAGVFDFAKAVGEAPWMPGTITADPVEDNRDPPDYSGSSGNIDAPNTASTESSHSMIDDFTTASVLPFTILALVVLAIGIIVYAASFFFITEEDVKTQAKASAPEVGVDGLPIAGLPTMELA